MPQAGVPARARRRYAASWSEELDGDAFRFPAADEVRPVRRAATRASNGSARAPSIRSAGPVSTRTADAASIRSAGPVSARSADAASIRTADPVSTRNVGTRTTPAPVRAVAVAVSAAPAPAPTPAPLAAMTARPAAAHRGGERRTVTIRGHGAERNLLVERPTLRRHERPGFRPDRAALWAVFLGLVLILVAVASAHGAVVH
jgi:hypothetical protein